MLHGDYQLWEGVKIWAFLVSDISQGIGMGPHIWAVSTLILDLLCQECYGATFQASKGRDTIQFAGCFFVNDKDLIQIGYTIQVAKNGMLPLMQAVLDIIPRALLLL